jgi:porin
MDYRVNIDAEKLLGLWKGLGFSLHAQTRWGEDITADAGGITLPNTPLLYPLPGDYSDSDITGLIVSQALLDGRVDLFAGKLNAIDLWTTVYPHLGYGQEGFWNVNALAAGWPWLRHVNLVMYGAGGWLVAKEGIQGALVAYGQDSVATEWNIDDSFNDGVGILGLWRFFWDIDDKPGSVLFAGGGASKHYSSLDPHDLSFIPGEGLVDDSQKKPWSAAVYVYQEFWHGAGDDGRKAYLYMAGSLADKNPSFVRWNVSATVEALGLLPIRDADRMGVAGWYNRVNEDVRDLAGVAGIRLRDGSWGVELYYNAAINRWLHLTGDLQIVQNENKSDDVAVIPGIRLVVDF